MGDGRVALILDVLGIGQRSGALGGFHETEPTTEKAGMQKAQAALEQQRLLLFRAGSFTRLAIPLSLVARLEEFPRSVIEQAGGGQVIQYRDSILPLVSLQAVLEPEAPEPGQPSDPVQVIVFNHGNRGLGMVVDQILDVAEEAVTVRRKSARKGILGSAVVGKQITDFLDLDQVLAAARENWFETTDVSADSKRILIVDPSAFSRGMIRSSLDMAGYVVFEAATQEEALRSLERQPVDILLAALSLPGGSELLAALRGRRESASLPVLALAETAAAAQAAEFQAAGYQDCQACSDAKAILQSVARLVAAADAAAAPESVEEKA
jgi:two-component system chemotaxis sensor kinase CheA